MAGSPTSPAATSPAASTVWKTDAQMIKAILTDIEGTTSSISFVKDVLFPYAARALPGFLHEHWDSAAVQEQVHALREQTGDALPDAEAVNALLQEWIQQDRKDT